MTPVSAARTYTSLVVFLVVCLAVFAFLFRTAGGRMGLGGDPYTVTVAVPDAFQLVKNGDVRRAGVKIGRVVDVRAAAGASRVRVEIDDDHAPLNRDARVRLRTKTLVGENYLDITPGSPRGGTVAGGAALPLDRADEAVQLDKILSTLDGPTRREVRRNLDELGTALDGRGGELNDLFAALNPTVRQGAEVASVLADQRRSFAAVIAQTGRVMQAFGERSDDVRTLATQARRAAEAARERDDELDAALDELPGTLRQARSTSRDLGRFSTRATPVLADLGTAVDSLAPVVRDLGPAAVSGRRLVRRLPPFLERAEPLLTRLRSFSRNVEPAVPQTDALLRQLNPFTTYMARYSKELGAFFAAVGSTTDVKDQVSNYLRVQQYYSAGSLSGFTDEMTAALKAITDAGLLLPLIGERRNAYPAPGKVSDPGAFSGDVPRVTPMPGGR